MLCRRQARVRSPASRPRGALTRHTPTPSGIQFDLFPAPLPVRGRSIVLMDAGGPLRIRHARPVILIKTRRGFQLLLVDAQHKALAYSVERQSRPWHSEQLRADT